jgi:hypothetical protein
MEGVVRLIDGLVGVLDVMNGVITRGIAVLIPILIFLAGGSGAAQGIGEDSTHTRDRNKFLEVEVQEDLED